MQSATARHPHDTEKPRTAAVPVWVTPMMMPGTATATHARVAKWRQAGGRKKLVGTEEARTGA